jgi:ABC-2 type transport system permease protein
MQTIILRELRDKKISLIVYCLALLGTLFMYASLYPTIQDSWQEMQKLYESYPKELYEAFGIQNLSIDSLEKFLAVEQFSFVWPIAALFFAVSRAGSALAGEIEKGVMGLYLSLPISRTKLYLAKYLSFLASLCIFITFSVFAVIPVAAIFNLSVNIGNISKVALLSFLFMWAVYAVALFVSAIVSERSKVYMLLGGGLIAMYVINVVASLKQSFSWLSNYSVFHYFNAQDILSGGTVTATSLVVFCLTIIGASILGVIAFNKRDISV